MISIYIVSKYFSTIFKKSRIGNFSWCIFFLLNIIWAYNKTIFGLNVLLKRKLKIKPSCVLKDIFACTLRMTICHIYCNSCNFQRPYIYRVSDSQYLYCYSSFKCSILRFSSTVSLAEIHARGYNARKVDCSCVYSAYILKPVLSGRNF